MLEWTGKIYFTPNRTLSRWSITLAFSNVEDQTYTRWGKLGINQLHSTCTFRISNWFVSLTHLVLEWTGKIYFTPNRTLSRWSITLAFSNVEDQTYTRWGKLGINQLHSTCTFRISNWFVSLTHLVLEWTGKIYFTPNRTLSRWSITLAFSNVEDQTYTRWGKLGINQLHSTCTFRISNWFVSLTHLVLHWTGKFYFTPNRKLSRWSITLAFSNVEDQTYTRWGKLGINQLHSTCTFRISNWFVSLTHLVLEWTGKIYFTPNRTLSRWSITLAFSNVEDQTYTRWGKLGINQLHSTCTFRISNWFVSLTHLVLEWTGKIYFTPNRTLSRWSITLAFSNVEDQTYTRWGKLGINQLHSTCTFRISNWFVSLTHLVLDWTGKIYFTPNRTLSRWSITLAFSNVEDQTYTRWGKLGINQLHSTCTFRISNWFVSLTHLVLDWTGKIYFTPNRTLSRWSITLAFSNVEDQTYIRWGKLGIDQLHSTCTFRISN